VIGAKPRIYANRAHNCRKSGIPQLLLSIVVYILVFASPSHVTVSLSFSLFSLPFKDGLPNMLREIGPRINRTANCEGHIDDASG
jgi:hypothetical protein